jgi:hypothetical protein
VRATESDAPACLPASASLREEKDGPMPSRALVAAASVPTKRTRSSWGSGAWGSRGKENDACTASESKGRRRERAAAPAHDLATAVRAANYYQPGARTTTPVAFIRSEAMVKMTSLYCKMYALCPSGSVGDSMRLVIRWLGARDEGHSVEPCTCQIWSCLQLYLATATDTPRIDKEVTVDSTGACVLLDRSDDGIGMQRAARVRAAFDRHWHGHLFGSR